MNTSGANTKIENIFCPTDLSDKSQKALGFAARLAETLDARLTAAHCAPANWFTQENRLPRQEIARIKRRMKECISQCQGEDSGLTWRSLVIENSFNPARDILRTASETGTDLIVMKARPGVLSAFHFGSIVERTIEASTSPILLLPSRYLDTQDPSERTPEFRRILFDYDFSDATDYLSQVVKALTAGYHAELQVLSVLEPMEASAREVAARASSPTHVRTMVRSKLKDMLVAEGMRNASAAVQWGRHADTVLEYASAHKIDLICTALPRPHFYFDKLYRGYLGSLLRSASCPILVKQAHESDKPADI